MEEMYEIGLIVGIECPNGKKYQELYCTNKDCKLIHVFVPVTNQCNIMADPDSIECQKCDEREKCEICEPVNIMLGGKLLIVDKGEHAEIRPINKAPIVKKKLERLREHARVLNLIADELEKTGGDKLGLHKCDECRHCHPGETGGTGWCTEQDAIVDQYTPRKCPVNAFQRTRGA